MYAENLSLYSLTSITPARAYLQAPMDIPFNIPQSRSAQLFLLFHGVGSTPHSMQGLAQFLSQHFPQAAVIGIAAPDPIRPGSNGLQWFSIDQISEENRIPRIEAAMPAFVRKVQHWQEQTQVLPEATALIGFSQGGIMALESTQNESLLAGRVISLAGRFARMPQTPHEHCTLHMIHGMADAVIPYHYTVTAAQHLVDQGADLTADVLPAVGHEINQQVLDTLLERLQSHVPMHIWRAAQQANAQGN